jgi:hypothetical protein
VIELKPHHSSNSIADPEPANSPAAQSITAGPNASSSHSKPSSQKPAKRPWALMLMIGGLLPVLAGVTLAFHPAINSRKSPGPNLTAVSNTLPTNRAGDSPTGVAAEGALASAKKDNPDIAGSVPAGAPGSAGKASEPSPEAVAITTVGDAATRLSQIGYWSGLAPKAGAKPDQRMRYAVLAFQRVEGRKPTGELGKEDLEALSKATAPVPLETGYAHVEVDLTRQVLFIVEADNRVSKVLPISSGSGKRYTFEGKTDRAVTPKGRFTVYSKIPGWRKAPLGMIYYPCYFDKGVAIHGSQSVPNYPASHGCIRIPIATAKELSDAVALGTVVLVYDRAASTGDAR